MNSAAAKPMMDVTEEQAKVLVGKHILVGITNSKSDGSVISREQFHGVVDRATLDEGLVINLHGSDKKRSVPLKLADLQVARLGEYHLNESNEIVKDPDYTLMLTLHPED